VEKWKPNWITWTFAALAVLVVVIMLVNTLRRPEELVLPDSTPPPDQTDGVSGANSNLTVVEVEPETVQAAIATLARPENYRRTVTVEQFWSGGSGSYEIAVAVRGPWTRADRTMPDGRVRHSITGPDTVHIWYNNEAEVYSASAGGISADSEQTIPTYEDILLLDPAGITAADYRSISGVSCIYTEAETEAYTLRYWVSVESGLLVAAEKLSGGEILYRMASLTVDQTEPADSEFTLPDGTVLQ